MKKIQYNGSSKILNGIVTKVNLIIDKLVVDVKVNGTSVVVVNEEGEREADIDLSLADQNVKQSPTTSSDNSDYRVLLSKSANDTEETDISRKDTNFKYNPSTGNLQTTKLNGNTVPSGSGNDTLAKTSDIPDMTNYIQKSLTVGLIKNDGTIDQTQYATMSDIPDELADLADDQTHRLVTDTEKTTWNGKAELTDVDKAELNTWNLLRQPYFHSSGSSSGTTRTVNADGSVTFTGTASATYNFNLKRYTQEWKLPKGTYRISGCPSGGSASTYFIRVAKYTTSQTNLADDYGDGATFTLTEESVMQINATVVNGYAIQGSLTFKPFIVPKEKVDEKVKQTSLTYLDDNNYRILLSKSASDSEETDGVNKYGDLLYNPYESKLTTSNVEFASANIHSITTVELLTAQYYFQNGSGNVVAMLEANSASQASNPTMLYLPSTTGTLATLADIPTVVDEKVKQTPENNSSSEFEVLLSGTADNTEHTEGAKKSSKLKFVPWNSSLEVGTLSSGFYDGSVEAGSIKGYGVSGIQLDAGDLSNKGTLSIYNNAGKAANIKFSNSATSDKSFEFPTVGGTIATLNDIPTITDTYDGTSPEGMSGIAVKSAIDALNVASTSIAASKTLATIKEENGKIAVTTQDISIGLTQYDVFYRCGTNNAISGSNTWHKIASKNITAVNTDAIIMLAISDGYIPDTDSASDSNGGILYCRVRQGSPVGTFSYAKLKFVANSGLDASKFRVYYTTSSSGITFEIWTSLSRQYAWRKYNVINQSSRTSHVSNEWTLYNSLNPTSAPTESATCVRVECEDNTYKQTDNETLGATNLIPYPYSGGSNASRNNVTISVNENGVITASGNAPSSGFGYAVASRTETIVLDPSKSYIMSGMTNGSGSTVRFLLDLWTASQNPTTDSYTTRLYQATTETTIPSGYKYLQISLYFYTGASSLFPLTVSPMLRLASIVDSTFKPYADTNRNLSMYKADLRLIADTEKTSTASRAYAKNELMLFDGNLYRVKTAIASGGSITLNTNVVATTLSAEIKAIRDALNI